MHLSPKTEPYIQKSDQTTPVIETERNKSTYFFQNVQGNISAQLLHNLIFSGSRTLQARSMDQIYAYIQFHK